MAGYIKKLKRTNYYEFTQVKASLFLKVVAIEIEGFQNIFLFYVTFWSHTNVCTQLCKNQFLSRCSSTWVFSVCYHFIIYTLAYALFLFYMIKIFFRSQKHTSLPVSIAFSFIFLTLFSNFAHYCFFFQKYVFSNGRFLRILYNNIKNQDREYLRTTIFLIFVRVSYFF